MLLVLAPNKQAELHSVYKASGSWYRKSARDCSAFLKYILTVSFFFSEITSRFTCIDFYLFDNLLIQQFWGYLTDTIIKRRRGSAPEPYFQKVYTRNTRRYRKPKAIDVTPGLLKITKGDREKWVMPFGR